MKLQDPLPSLSLSTPEGEAFALERFADGRALIVAVLCNHCPFVKHIAPALGAVVESWSALDVRVVAINPNAMTHPGDAPERMGSFAASAGWSFPYLVDAEQSATTALGAQVTPDLFVFGSGLRLAYHGRFDASTPGNGLAATGSELDLAVRAVARGAAPTNEQVPTLGCSVKWQDAETLPDA